MIDDVAAEHPEPVILIAHPAFPWEMKQLAICQQKSNVYMSLSGWMPRYVDDQVLRYSGTSLSEEVMFGTDYPMLEPGAWLEDVAANTDYPSEFQRKRLWENAEAYLGL